MATLTVEDLRPEALAKQKEALQACERELAVLLSSNARDKGVEDQVATLQMRKNALQQELQWRALMLEVEADSTVQKVTTDVEEAAATFRQSIVVPPGYEGQAGEDGGMPIPFSETDDFADMAPVEAAVDACISDAHELLRCYSATASSSTSTPLIVKQKASSGGNGAHSNGSLISPEESTRYRRRALLMLLVLSVHVGKVDKLCRFDTIRDPSNVPVDTADDLREEVASEWQWALYESKVLTEEEMKEWVAIVKTFLGPPFDSAP